MSHAHKTIQIRHLSARGTRAEMSSGPSVHSTWRRQRSEGLDSGFTYSVASLEPFDLRLSFFVNKVGTIIIIIIINA